MQHSVASLHVCLGIIAHAGDGVGDETADGDKVSVGGEESDGENVSDGEDVSVAEEELVDHVKIKRGHVKVKWVRC